ncbi:MAG: hypothetical protein JRE64_10125 [Deltaproteobacteria bacterium]|nr:hypothetical protein [Deltaproteobacteria bacterium]
MTINENMGKRLLKKTCIYSFWREYHEIRDYWRWLKNGMFSAPPHGIKQGVVKKYAKNYNCQLFFETGTYLGDMIQAVKDDFKHIYSVELSEQLYRQAQLRFKKNHHITLLQGDSGKVIQESLKQIQEPCLFWLDAHYSGGITAKGDKLSPVMEEVVLILTHSVKNHVILIDDAREFTGRDGYPELSELKEKVAMLRPELNFAVKKDIIRIVKEI